MTCPNKNTDEFRNLAAQVGELKAIAIYFENGESFPETNNLPENYWRERYSQVKNKEDFNSINIPGIKDKFVRDDNYLYHGTNSYEVDDKENLILIPSKNFSNKTSSISFTSIPVVAQDYMLRKRGKVIIKIKNDAIKNQSLEAEEEVAVNTDIPIIISKQNYEIITVPVFQDRMKSKYEKEVNNITAEIEEKSKSDLQLLDKIFSIFIKYDNESEADEYLQRDKEAPKWYRADYILDIAAARKLYKKYEDKVTKKWIIDTLSATLTDNIKTTGESISNVENYLYDMSRYGERGSPSQSNLFEELLSIINLGRENIRDDDFNIIPEKYEEVKDIVNEITQKVKQEEQNSLNLFKDSINKEKYYNNSNSINGSNEELDNKMKNLIEKMGFGVDFIENSRFANQGSNGVADMLGKMVYISMNKAKIDTLPEEAAHVFVEMLKQQDHPLYYSMMNDIEKFNIYKAVENEYSEIYENDKTKLKEEAIGKAIANIIVKRETNEDDSKLLRINSWFDRVLNWFKSKLSGADIENIQEANDYFGIAADQLLSGEVSEIKKTDTVFRQATILDKLKTISDKLEIVKEKTKEGIESFYTINGSRVKTRVSQIVKAGKSTPDLSPEDRITFDKMAEWGTFGHDDLMNLWKESNKEITSFKPNTDPDTVTKLRRFVNNLRKEFPDSTFLPEIKIYDKKRDLAGTIDLVVVHPDETISIFDYKFINELSNDTITNWRKRDWTIQLGQYRQILKEVYGVKGFRQARIIPIKATYSGELDAKRLVEIEIGNNKLQDLTALDYLNPIPVLEEKTGITQIDDLIKDLNFKLNDAVQLPEVTTQQQITRATKIKDIEAAINKLKIGKDASVIENLVIREIDRTKSLLKKLGYNINAAGVVLGKPENITYLEDSEIVELNHSIDFYSKLITKGYGATNAIVDMSNFAQKISTEVTEIFKQHLKVKNVDINNTIKPTTWYSRLMGLSDYDLPPFKALYKLLTDAWFTKDKIVAEKHTELLAIKQQIEKEGGKIEELLQMKNGKPNGNLINPKDSKWYEYHKSLVKQGEAKIKSLNVFNFKDYNKFIIESQDEFKESIKTFSASEQERQLEFYTKSLKNKHSIKNPNSKYYNIPDQYITKEYIKIRDNPNSGIAKLYNYYMEINKFAIENTNVDLKRMNMLPYVKKGTIQQIFDNPNIRNLKDNIYDSLKTHEHEVVDIDENGQPLNKVPLSFNPNSRFDPELQDYDLIKIGMMWTDAVYTNYHLQQTVDTSNLLRLGLKKSRQYITQNGKINDKSEVIEKITNSETLSQFNDYLQQEIYGIKIKTPDKDIGGFSMNKVVKTVIQYSSAKTLAFNPFSAVAQLTGGFAFATSVGAKGTHFTNKQFYGGLTKLHDSKVRSLISIFDVDANVYDANKYNDLSLNGVSKHLTFDKFFILLKKGDWLLQNGTLVAMAQNYTVKEGKIVKKTDKHTKNLLELINNDKDGKILIEGIEIGSNEFYKFREKVRGVSSEITGNSSEYDKVLAGNTLVHNVLLQYRRWILPMATSRFGAFRHNTKMDEYQLGKYRSFADVFFNKQIISNAKELILMRTDSGSFNDLMTQKFEEAKLLNPELQETDYEGFKQLYMSNIRSAFMEVAMLGSVTAILLMLKGDDDDDDDKSLARKLLINALGRTSDEISFWYNPTSFLNILKSPIPIIGFVQDLIGLLENGTKAIFDPLIDGEQDHLSKGGDKLIKLTIGFNTYYKVMDSIE